MTEVVVLTEYAGQVAAREEDGARPSAAYERRLFTKVRAGARDARERAGSTGAQLTGQTVYSATPRAEGAAAEAGPSFLGPSTQFA